MPLHDCRKLKLSINTRDCHAHMQFALLGVDPLEACHMRPSSAELEVSQLEVACDFAPAASNEACTCQADSWKAWEGVDTGWEAALEVSACAGAQCHLTRPRSFCAVPAQAVPKPMHNSNK